ncbi:hypothetical protein [Desulfosporosinus meridiei]|uniref:CARDB domain-containing protein n=1 Tax=Desulfosporosinus meridiei (strain ATCC BAA-275 / DSM 13257 / KCTC 12902 / NCIMB 13706 / S10) TaxID=768704 RepID=J7ILH8_DESMD|nr:hypothetical protein [Desulfosporosinus meridiei]AFQ42400.1 hypothetical protein Desmer_0339 [Desulfosporosinus meridiei DSM 13257]
MPNLTTGLFENAPVGGVRPSTMVSVNITNDGTTSQDVQIQGFFQSGTTKVLYVLELLVLAPGGVVLRNYFADFDAFEFQFVVSSEAVEVTVWGKDAAGNLTIAHRVVAQEVNPF